MTVSISCLSTQNLVCGFPNRKVLENVDLVFSPGSATAILGPNGSGKSTLLKTLSGEVACLGGKVKLWDSPIAQMSIEEIGLRIAIVPQQEHIPFRFTAWEVAMMGRMVRSKGIWDTAEDRNSVRQALEFTDAFDFAERPVNELSGGERQRVLLARAIAQETDIILLDEPTTHLDVTHQIQLCALAKKLVESGKTIIAAMHDLNLVSHLADRAILLGLGSVQLDGKVDEVMSSPQLDEVYGVKFRKIADNGQILVLPPEG
jgi:iron complex transport system ATP-binding protein